MHVTFWGTRGSIAKAGPSTVRYGGNTSCVEVTSDGGTLLVLDCGTGAHGLGVELSARAAGGPLVGHLLISHTHWDHIQGLPFFAPLFQPGNRWHIYGPRGLGDSLSETLAGQMQYSYFPVTIDQLAADVTYHDLVEGQFTIDDVVITTRYLNHPALTLGYRIEADGATVVYSSDHECHDPGLAGGGDLTTSRHDSDHAGFLAGADLVIHDAQYLADEYPTKEGWGHSTVEYVVDVAGWARARTVALFHHDPGRDDAAVDQLVGDAVARAVERGHDVEVIGAAEGTTLELRGSARAVGGSSELRAAIDQPAMHDTNRRVLIAIQDEDVAGALAAAAAAEELETTVTSVAELGELSADLRPALLLVDDDAESLALADAIRRGADGQGSAASVVAVTRRGGLRLRELGLTDSLTWPASDGYVRTKLRAWLLRRATRWQNAPLPVDEAERLAALHRLGVLDTAPEERFDRYTRLASDTLEMPVALVTLVDADRQWFKSRVGTDVEQTPRDMAVCAHAILTDDIFQVPDATRDARFAENPLVVNEPYVRFYAGVPLELSDGHRVGTLCVIDYRPRVLDDDQLRELRRLGTLVTAELETPATD